MVKIKESILFKLPLMWTTPPTGRGGKGTLHNKKTLQEKGKGVTVSPSKYGPDYVPGGPVRKGPPVPRRGAGLLSVTGTPRYACRRP